VTPPKPRRSRGEGSYTYSEKTGLHRYILDLGIGGDGKRKTKAVTSRTKAGALAKFRALRKTVEEHGGTVPASMTVEAWLTQWLNNVTVKPSTLANYRSTVRLYLVPTLGKRRLDKLSSQHVRDMLTWMGRETDTHPDGLSASTLHRAHRVLNVALNDAIREGILRRNVAEHVKAPSLTGKDQATIELDQARALMVATFKDWYGPRWSAALILGARQGEILGMEWDRVDLEQGTLDLSWQLQRLGYRHGCGDKCGVKRAGSCPDRQLDVKKGFEYRRLDGGLCLTRPKSSAGVRLIPIPALLEGFLRLQAKQQAGKPNPHGLVFTRPDGRPIDPSRDSEEWHAALTKAGVPSIKLHAARHTAASLLLSAGVSDTVIQAILGHSTVAMTRAYQHADQTLTRAAMERLGSMLAIEGDTAHA